MYKEKIVDNWCDRSLMFRLKSEMMFLNLYVYFWKIVDWCVICEFVVCEIMIVIFLVSVRFCLSMVVRFFIVGCWCCWCFWFLLLLVKF